MMINDKKFMKFDIPDGLYDVGMRPENFRISEDGFATDIKNIYHIGRDTMIHFDFNGKNVRALVDSDDISHDQKVANLSIKSERIYIFDKETGQVINHG